MKCRISVFALFSCLALAGLLAVPALGQKGGTKGRSAANTARPIRLGSRLAATLLLSGRFPKEWQKRAGGDVRPRHLVWPLRNRPLGRGFGSDNGRHLAVDVTAPIGTRVRAMSSGIVGYAASGVRGYGKMMLLLHSGGWVTLYAHLSGFKAKPGEWVKRGEVIALTGNTGLSRGPHLHFALIVRGKPVDPVPHMRHVPGRKKRLATLFGTNPATSTKPTAGPAAPPG